MVSVAPSRGVGVLWFNGGGISAGPSVFPPRLDDRGDLVPATFCLLPARVWSRKDRRHCATSDFVCSVEIGGRGAVVDSTGVSSFDSLGRASSWEDETDVLLIVRQMEHLKSWRSLGQRTSDPHVIHRPVLKSLLPGDEPWRRGRVWWGRLGACIGPASSVGSESELSAAIWLVFFFRPENSEGKGWLKERLWWGREGFWGRRGWISWSDELDSTWIWWLSKISKSGDRDVPEYLLTRASACERRLVFWGGGGRDMESTGRCESTRSGQGAMLRLMERSSSTGGSEPQRVLRDALCLLGVCRRRLGADSMQSGLVKSRWLELPSISVSAQGQVPTARALFEKGS